MTKRSKILIVGASVLALAAGGTAVAVATGGDDNEQPITGSDLDRASAAALEHTGGGEVVETETGDEESYYEVEVRQTDGSVVSVQLDRSFDVVTGATDAEDSGEDEGAGDDD